MTLLPGNWLLPTLAAVLIAVSVLLLVGGGAEPTSAPLLLLPLAGAAFGVFFTAVTIARFGNAGGSVYFSPTALHIFLLLAVAFAVVRELWR